MATDFTATIQNEHFRAIAAILHIPTVFRGWRYSHPTVPFHTLNNALVKSVDPERPYQEKDVLTAFVELQMAIVDADRHLVMPVDSVAWLTERILSSDGKWVMPLLLAYAGARWEYATPAEVAEVTGTNDSWWRQQAIAGTIPGTIKKGKQWLLPVDMLKLRGVDVSKLWARTDEDDGAPLTDEEKDAITEEHVAADVVG